MTKRSVVLLAVAIAAVGAYGCASPFHGTVAKLELRPHALEAAAAPARPSASDAAVKAIGARDYVRALDLLQVARAQQPNDPAILNAFGVAYDKLGRLDLSARYYAQARELDPGSEIVRRNMAYSDQLRARTLAGATPPAVPAAQPVVVAAAPAPKAVVIPAAAPVPLIRVADNGALLIGRGMKVVDASGLGLAQPVKAALGQRGWSVPRSAPPTATPQARTTVIYPAGGVAVAQALARTLHGPVSISVCNDNCTRVTLVVGQDARRWVRGARS